MRAGQDAVRREGEPGGKSSFDDVEEVRMDAPSRLEGAPRVAEAYLAGLEWHTRDHERLVAGRRRW